MKIAAARDLILLERGHDHTVLRVEIETDELLEKRAARIAEISGLSQNIVMNQALVTGLLLALMKRGR